jgi:hypothetical protein
MAKIQMVLPLLTVLLGDTPYAQFERVNAWLALGWRVAQIAPMGVAMDGVERVHGGHLVAAAVVVLEAEEGTPAPEEAE